MIIASLSSPSSPLSRKRERNENYPKPCEERWTRKTVIVLGVYVLIISIIVFLHWAAVWADQCQSEELNTRILKLAVKQLVADGLLKCYRTGGNIDETG